ncbi:MAG: YfhO family protein, partial [Acidobacteria bacterium]|nr:YfhO family protein [Acidobacteriota bacterium]
RSMLSGALLVLVLMADLAAYGGFLEWPLNRFSVTDRLADPPTVKYIKAQESDLNSFRIMSRFVKDYSANTDMLNYPNSSIARGLQSASGHDMLRMDRPAAVMGEMNPIGLVPYSVFDAMDQGLNLFNVKYALLERPRQIIIKPENGIANEGIRFSEQPLELNFRPGSHYEIAAGGAGATELAIISEMNNSVGIIDGAPMLKFKLHTKDGRVIEHELQAGRDSSEWAYDRADVRPIIKHARARVIESWPVGDRNGNYQGHRYLARLPFERAEIEKIEMDYLRSDAGIVITRASLIDSTTGSSTPLDSFLTPERWRKLATFGEVDLYQNLKAMPRAWFVNKVMAMSSADVLQTIKRGKDPDGQPFNPAETALMDKDGLGERKISLPHSGAKTGAEVSVTHYGFQRIELRTRNPQAGFLVLSEVYYPGWIARVDGVETPIHRVNYTLRGLEVPPGDHEISFVYEAPTFRLGAMISGLGVIILL